MAPLQGAISEGSILFLVCFFFPSPSRGLPLRANSLTKVIIYIGSGRVCYSIPPQYERNRWYTSTVLRSTDLLMAESCMCEITAESLLSRNLSYSISLIHLATARNKQCIRIHFINVNQIFNFLIKIKINGHPCAAFWILQIKIVKFLFNSVS